MEGAMKLAFAAVAASIGLGLRDPSFACSLSPDAIAKRPRLDEVVTSRPIVFIGTVVDVLPGEKLFIGDPPRDVSPPLERDPFAKAKFKIEIPIRGVTGDFIEIRNEREGVGSVIKSASAGSLPGTRTGAIFSTGQHCWSITSGIPSSPATPT
jgi:hypothetical protein